jgi:transposase
VNRLHAALDLVFPELPPLCGSLHRPTALALLRAYPTAAALAGAAPAEVRALLRQASRGRFAPARADALLAAARAMVAVRAAAAALARKVGALVRQLAQLNQELADLDAAIRAQFAALGHRPADFPTGGVLTLAALLAEAGDVRRFPSAKQFVAHFGWCPADTQSGAFKDAHPRLSKAGNRYVQRLLWMLAVQSVSAYGLPVYRAYFARRTAAGKNKMDTLVAVGRKLHTTIYASSRPAAPTTPPTGPPVSSPPDRTP